MINMMYLVLTALLALNVSAEILNAFKLVNEGIQASTKALQVKNEWTYEALQKQLEINERKARPYYERAQLAKRYSEELIAYVEELKERIIKLSGGIDEETGDLKDPKNLDIASQVMLTEGKGKELQQKINETRQKLLELIKEVAPEMVESFENRIPLKAEDPPYNPEYGNRSWAAYNFEMVPTIAAVTILNKLQNDARVAEAEVINFLLSSIGAADFKFDVLTARVVAPTSYVLLGQEYKADIFVSATSSTQNPDIYIGRLDPKKVKVDSVTGLFVEVSENPLVEIYDSLDVVAGIGRYIVRPAREGIIQYEGAVKVRKPTGEFAYFPFKAEFMAARPAAVVSPDKMNVFYIGVDNPITVSVPGFPAEDVMVVISQGSVSPVDKKQGKYIVRVVTPGKATVGLSVKLPDGGTRKIGDVEFRVKRIPDPEARVGDVKPGKVAKSTFAAQLGLLAYLPAFDFDVKFEVLSFEVVYKPLRADPTKVEVTGPRFPERVIEMMKKARPGDSFSFFEIKVKAPDGTIRTLPSITYEII